MRQPFPFSAIVGQERLKTALVLNAVDPLIGGVLIRGEKGTAKSTAVRAFAALLPSITAVTDCPYHCDPSDPDSMDDVCRSRRERGEALPTDTFTVPLVEVPINATEDRLVGTISIESALAEGRVAFEPGLLARANRGMLYVDEVNLFPDHLVDMLLDAAASGSCIVERDSVSVRHPSRFVLIGTMNPEEGELRPQFLDRFGLCVTIRGLESPEGRREVISRRMAYDRGDAAALERWNEQDRELSETIEHARELLPEVRVPNTLIALIVEISSRAATAGHRADIVLSRTSAAIAALLGKRRVTVSAVYEAARLVLPHRLRSEQRGRTGSTGGDTTGRLSPLSEQIDDLIRRISRDSVEAQEEWEPEDEIGEDILETMQVPGGPAAGSILLPIFNKKKRKNPRKVT